MLFYNLGAILKLVVGSAILYYLFNYVNVYQDFNISLIFGFLGVFLLIWGFSFYLFYIVSRFISKKSNQYLASKSYKTSLLFGLYILINLGLIIMDKWTKLLGLIIFVLFIVLQMLTVSEND